MKLSKILTYLLLLSGVDGWCQSSAVRGDFMFPVRPKQENYLSGTMGELRSSHFHSGLDIKTSGITGLPIYAAADGYVQRIRVSLNGYGNAIYLVHPQNGTVTVYAHLKSFQEEIAKYVRARQYEKESFEVDLYPNKSDFSFKKGDVIALSGNSGSSSGPHLHFEVRNLRHRALDPLTYGFDEIVDNKPPVLEAIAFVTMNEHARVNGMFGRVEFDVKTDERGNAYIEEGISLFGEIGVEIYAYDKFDGARNRNGVRFQSMYFDGNMAFEQKIEELNFGYQRNILSHTNYKRSKEGGRRFNKLYVDDGNLLNFYKTNTNQGVVRIYDPLEHQIDIRLEDAYGNINQVNLKINDREFSRDRELKHTYGLDNHGFDIQGHFLEVESEEGYCIVDFFVNGQENAVDMAYYTEISHHFIWDLRLGLPDSVKICDNVRKFNFVKNIPSGQKQDWIGERMAISFPKNSLFDTTYLQYRYYENEKGLEVFEFKNATTPLRQFITLNIKPKGVYDFLKTGIYGLSDLGSLQYVGGEWEGEEMVFKSRDLVRYTIATDSIPPEISLVKSKQGQLTFKIKDEMSGIHSMHATLNDKWLLMKYDAKRGRLWSDEKVNVAGKFVLSIKDNANNITRFEEEF